MRQPLQQSLWSKAQASVYWPLHAHEQVRVYLHKCKQSVPATQRKWEHVSPSLSLAHTHTSKLIHIHLQALKHIHTHTHTQTLTWTHTICSIKTELTVWKHRAQQASLVSYFWQDFQWSKPIISHHSENSENTYWQSSRQIPDLTGAFADFLFFMFQL